MPVQSKRWIITNRQLNFTLCPVDLHNPKEMPYSLSNYDIDGTWNQHQSIILDVLIDRIFKAYYAEYKNIPKSWRPPTAIEGNKKFFGALFHPVILKYLSNKPVEAFSMNEGYDVVATERSRYDSASSGEEKKATFEEFFENSLKGNHKYQTFIAEMTKYVSVFRKDIPMKLTISELFKKYPILNQRPYKGNLFEYAQKIAGTKFRMNYKLRCIVKAPEYSNKGKRTHKGTIADGYYEMNDFQQIFTVDLDEDCLVLNFKSPLGKMIFHNMIVVDTDWISDEVLTLGKNAYFIYKRFILNRVSGRNPPNEIELWFEDMRAFLDLNGKNISGSYAAIDRAFQEIQQKGLIKDYSWNKNYSKQRQYRLIFDHSPKKNDKKRGSGYKLQAVPT